QLREWNSELGGPAQRIDLRGDIPHRVPRAVLLAIIKNRVIALHAVRVHVEIESRAFVVVRIDEDDDLIARATYITARERMHDAVWMRIVRAHEHEQVVLIERDLEFGAERRIRVFARLELAEFGDLARGLPDCITRLPVNDRCLRSLVRDCSCRRLTSARRSRLLHGLYGRDNSNGGYDCTEFHLLIPKRSAAGLDSTTRRKVAIHIAGNAFCNRRLTTER